MAGTEEQASDSYLGIDIGGTKVALRLTAELSPHSSRAIEDSFRWPPASDGPRDLALLTERVQALTSRWPDPITAVGVAVPALFNACGIVRTWPSRPHWAGIRFVSFLERVFAGIPAFYADDGDLAALAEARQMNCANLLYFGVGTGIGGGIVHNGRPWPGLARGSCEVGHIVVERNGPRCDCGRRGCVQAVASGPATLRLAARLAGRDLTFAELAGAVGAGEPWAVTAIGASTAVLASAVVGVCELAQPDAVVIGGGFASGMPGYVTSVQEHVRRMARPGIDLVPVRPAVLGSRSSLQGALELAAGVS